MRIISHAALVVGSGAAGYACACRLKERGVDAAVVTEGVLCGTSRNTGSDKQTYYKLSLAGDEPDSVRLMAEDLFRGGSVDGDNALCEAALSVRAFLHLCELGVEFPSDRYGRFVGYKTDHDPRARATSAGPLTSKMMTEALERRAAELRVPVYDGYLAAEVLKDEKGVAGLLCIEKKTGDFVAFRAPDVVLATGGPAGIYADSVYPECHTGTESLALLAGAAAQNMTEWQYGLASVSPRWNVSGTYMQVLPRFVSVDGDGTEREFLLDFFRDPYRAMSCVFLKGYQWPFDSAKVMDGSSVIDLLVYRERVMLGRRVYLDYMKNPFGIEEIDFGKLDPEAGEYLARAGADFGTPVARLEKMNMPAVELYRSFGVDVETDELEISLSAQHMNGGISVDKWWQTSVPGLFAAGECAGTHGVSRPGGSALNAGQTGALRAAGFIAAHGREQTDEQDFLVLAAEAEAKHKATLAEALGDSDNVDVLIGAARRRMSDGAGAIRDPEKMRETLAETEKRLANLRGELRIGSRDRLYLCYKYLDTLMTSRAVLTAMIDYADRVGASRGSALYRSGDGVLRDGLPETFRFVPGNGEANGKVQEIRWDGEKFSAVWRPVRPIPEDDTFFENVWRGFRENGNVY